MIDLDNVIEICQKPKELDDAQIWLLDEMIVRALGWGDKFGFLSDNISGYPKVTLQQEKPYPPQFTKSIYEVIPYLPILVGWDIKIPCDNDNLGALVGPLPLSVRLYNLHRKIDVVATGYTLEFAFCAAWLKVVKATSPKSEETITHV